MPIPFSLLKMVVVKTCWQIVSRLRRGEAFEKAKMSCLACCYLARPAKDKVVYVIFFTPLRLIEN